MMMKTSDSKTRFDFLGDLIPPFEFYANIDKDERFKRFFSVNLEFNFRFPRITFQFAF